MNARSEFVEPTNFSGGRVSETTFRFHAALPASVMPPLRPMRGSTAGVADCDTLGVLEHAASDRSPAAMDNDQNGVRDGRACDRWDENWAISNSSSRAD